MAVTDYEPPHLLGLRTERGPFGFEGRLRLEETATGGTRVTDVVECLDAATWQVVTAEEHDRTINASGGRVVPLRDVVVRATRRVHPE